MIKEGKVMKFLLILMVMFFFGQSEAKAVNECGVGGGYDAHCGIWLCGPYGFPGQCGLQKQTFFKRLAKRGCSAVPSYSACGTGNSGRYKIDTEYQPCKSGFDLETLGNKDSDRAPSKFALCVKKTSSCDDRGDSNTLTKFNDCDNYRTPLLNYIEFNVDGKTYPKYYWR